MTNIRSYSRDSLLGYLQDCHGLSAYDLHERDVNVKSKADVAEVIECYGWAVDCQQYLAA